MRNALCRGANTLEEALIFWVNLIVVLERSTSLIFWLPGMPLAANWSGWWVGVGENGGGAD